MHNRVAAHWGRARPGEQAGKWDAGPGRQWREAEARLLAAVGPRQRGAVRALLLRLPAGSLGLHCWLCALAWEAAFLPARVPPGLVQVYLDDPEAAPLAECADCHLALPVRPPWAGPSGGRCYFLACPSCGGRPGNCCPP